MSHATISPGIHRQRHPAPMPSAATSAPTRSEPRRPDAPSTPTPSPGAATQTPGSVNPAAASHALVESPLQFLSALEARRDDEPLIIHARRDAAGMPTFLDQFPTALLPAGVVVTSHRQPADSLPRTGGRVLIGDVLSGQFQRQLVGALRTGQLSLAARPRRGPAELVLLDDGLATVSAARTLARHGTHPLLRAALETTPARTALGQAAAFIVRRLMRAGRLTWFTAMKVDKHLVRTFTAAGGRLHRHKFEWTRGLDFALPTGHRDGEAVAGSQHPAQVILGTAFAADGLITTDAYVSWVQGLVTAHAGPSVYYPHRRQTDATLARLRAIAGLRVAAPGLPVELRLAQAPKRTVVRSLPSTAVTTLPLVMRHPLVTVDPIPEGWWTRAQPDSKRRALNELTNHALPSKKPRRPAVRILAVADSESYLKWAISLLERLSADHDHISTDVVLMDSPIRPTGPQIAHAVAGTRWQDLSVPVVKRSGLRGLLKRQRPTIVLAAATGPVVSQIYGTAVSLKHRPGLASGLPGIGLPATAKGQRYRRLGDLFITHSPVESTAYDRAIAAGRGRARTVVTHLPMLGTGRPGGGAAAQPGRPGRTQEEHAGGHNAGPGGSDAVHTVVFAPQAKVPHHPWQRMAILETLAGWQRNGATVPAPAATTDFAPISPRRVILKVRSMPGEHETHLEAHSYLALRRELIQAGRITPEQIEVAVGPMSNFLTPGSALVTISSTAALEALDRDLPVIALTDFGVGDKLLNQVFAGSGLQGTLDDVRDGLFHHAREDWLAHNYFHNQADELFEEFAELSHAAADGELERDVVAAFSMGWLRLRAELRSAVPAPAISVFRRLRRR